MKNLILAIAATSIVAAPVYADDDSKSNKHEAAGVGTGLAIGAAIGGPIGAIIGAALGGKLGDKYHEERTARIEFESGYELARAQEQELRTQLRSREERIAQMQRTLREEESSYRATVQEALNSQVFFRTGDSELSDESVERLGRIAQLVGSMDGFVVRLSGHADNRGAEEYNEQLSAARAVAVRDALIAAGVPGNRIAVSAEGERDSRAGEKDLDGLAMERRVQIELVSSESDELVAARP